jgi:hypothetical protein
MQSHTNDYTRPIILSNTQFLINIFGEQWVNAHVTSFIDDPANIKNDRHKIVWAGDYYRNTPLIVDSNQFFTVSTFTPDDKGRSRRRISNFVAQYCVVLDDVLEKLDPEQAARLPPPSWILQTSPGSQQWGYILETPSTNRLQLDNLTDGLIESKLAPDSKDPGMRGVTRYMRLPAGVNTKASKQITNVDNHCQLFCWNPGDQYTLKQLAEPFDIKLDAVRKENNLNGNAVDMPDHPIFEKLHVKSDDGNGKVEITCPWLHEHSERKDDNGTVIWTNDNYALGFKCHHGHCEQRTASDVVKKVCEEDEPYRKRYRDWDIKHCYDGVETLFPELFQGVPKEQSEFPQQPLVTTTVESDEGFIELLDKLPLKKLINLKVIRMAWDLSFETGGNNKVAVLKPNGMFYTLPKSYGNNMLSVSFGSLIQEDMALIHFTENDGPKAAQKSVETYKKFVTQQFFAYLSKHKQVNTIQYEVDIYAKESRLEISRDYVRLFSTFEPFVVNDRPAEETVRIIVNDYIQHFPHFMDYLESVAAARFSPDRRHAGVWIRAGAGWGKSFLMQIFKNLEIVVSLTENQVKTCCSGSPVGLNPNQFLNAWIVEFDEFKTVNNDMKRINNTMMLSPKNQMASEVNIYNKTFLSAEIVASLVGEYGVENQFSDRIAYLPVGDDRLDDRVLFNTDKMLYLNALVTFSTDYLNKFVDDMRQIGKKSAEKGAMKTLKIFHTRYHFDNHHNGIVDGIDQMVGDIRELIYKFADPMSILSDGETVLKRILRPNFTVGYHQDYGPVSLLKSPYKFIERYINEQVGKSEQSSLQLKKYPILDLIDPDWRDARRIKTTHGKSIRQRGVMVELNGFEVVDFM